jgi:hypothetical protein
MKMTMMKMKKMRVIIRIITFIYLLEVGDDDDFRPAGSKTNEEYMEEAESNQADNPLPGFIDSITLCEVEKPAISPFGHVLS